jgi:hypothetical protein
MADLATNIRKKTAGQAQKGFFICYFANFLRRNRFLIKDLRIDNNALYVFYC